MDTLQPNPGLRLKQAAAMREINSLPYELQTARKIAEINLRHGAIDEEQFEYIIGEKPPPKSPEQE